MKIYQIFESYPLFYQPYIPPVLEKLTKREELDTKIIAFRGKRDGSKEAFILPNYRSRKLYEKLNQSLSKNFKGLNYLEIKALKEKIDIIHIQHSFLFKKVINLLKKPKTQRPKIVITLRGGDTYVKPWLAESWNKFYKDYGEKVDAFIVMSEDQKKYLSRWGVPLSNIHVIPISFGDRFESEPKYPNKNKLKLVSVFRMCWEKNITDSLRLIKILKEKNVPVSYDVYGDGPDLGQLYYLRDKYDLNDEINIKGKVSNRELKQKLSSYDFIIQLSHSESFGMSIVEAQTFGVPAIISANGGLSEIVRDGVNGIVLSDLLNMNIERIYKIWKDKDLYHEFSKNAKEISQNRYNVNKEVDSLARLYTDLLKT